MHTKADFFAKNLAEGFLIETAIKRRDWTDEFFLCVTFSAACLHQNVEDKRKIMTLAGN